MSVHNKKQTTSQKQDGFDINVYCFDAQRKLVGHTKATNIPSSVMDSEGLFDPKMLEMDTIDAIMQAKGTDVAGRIDLSLVCYTNNAVIV